MKRIKPLIIVDSGKSKIGKSSVIEVIWNRLLDHHDMHDPLLFDPYSVDADGVLFIKGVRVGVSAKEGYNIRGHRSLEDFLILGCGIVVIACKTSGVVYDMINDVLHDELGWDVVWYSHTRYNGANEEQVREKLNQQYADKVVSIIEARVAGKDITPLL